MALSTEDLLTPFLRGIKTQEAFKLGVELEYFPVDRNTLRILPFSGERGIARVLETMVGQSGYSPVHEGQNVIGLERNDGASVTLEPGGAMEYSSAPARSLREVESQTRRFLSDLEAVMADQDTGLMAVGFHPFDTPQNVQLVPKSRYRFMYDYMPSVGSTGRFMMKVTCSVQIAIDFDSEADAMRKFRLAAQLTPVFVALSANSSMAEGACTERASNRAFVWLDTDPSRCGFQTFAFGDESRFDDYVEWALDAPMYFLRRRDELIDMSGQPFRQFNAGVTPGGEPTLSDWELHLNTLFPWVRLRDFIEIRCFDMNPLPISMALVALVKGIFYHEPSLKAAESLCSGFDAETTTGLLHAAINRGLDGVYGKVSLRDLARLLVSNSRQGLAAATASDVSFLDPLESLTEEWTFDDVKGRLSANPAAFARRGLVGPG